MGRLEVFIAPPGSGKNDTTIRAFACATPPDARSAFQPDFLFIVPTHRMARAVDRRVLECRGAGFFGRHALTWDDFVGHAFHILHDAPVLPPGARELLLADILRRGDWNHFRDVSRFPGVASEIGRLISEWKHGGIASPDDLRRLSRSTPLRGDPRFAELLKIFDAYAARLRAGGNAFCRDFVDSEDQARLVANALGGSTQNILPGIRRIAVLGFYDFTKLQRTILKGLAGHVEVTVALDLDPRVTADDPRLDRVYRLPSRTLSFLKDANPSITESHTSPSNPSAVASRLFAGSRAAMDGQIDASSFLEILPCRDRVREVEAIASRVKSALLADSNLPPHEILVCFPSLQPYREIVRETFESFGIPVNLAEGHRLDASPVAVALSDMLDAAENNFPRDAVFRFLSSAFVAFKQLSLVPGGAWEIDSVARDARIPGGPAGPGRAEWETAFARHSAELDSEAALAEKDADPDEHSKNAARIAHLKKSLSLAGEALRFLFDSLSPLSGSRTMTPEKFRDALRRLIRIFGIEQNVYRPSSPHLSAADVERNCRALSALDGLLEELVFGLRFISGPGDVALPVSELTAFLRVLIGDASFHSRLREDGCVQALDMLETRGLSFRRIFIGGLTDADVPCRRPPMPLVSPAEIRSLGIDSIRADLSEDRFLFIRLFSSTCDRLTLSHPLWEGDAELAPSTFVDEVRRVCRPDAYEHLSAFNPHSAREDFARSLFVSDPPLDDIRARSLLPDAHVYRHILRTARVEWLRGRSASLTPYDGVLASPVAPPARFSASQLETYARCPFRYLSSRVLNLGELAEVEEDVAPEDRGRAVHEILRRFYESKYNDATGASDPVTESSRPSDAALLLQFAREQIDTLPAHQVFKERLLYSLCAGLTDEFPASPGAESGMLSIFLTRELDPLYLGAPLFLEASFGSSETAIVDRTKLDAPPLVLKTHNGNQILIVGRIDRVDGWKGTDGTIRFLVTDYKTGATNDASCILRGLDYQLPIYILSLEHCLGTSYLAAGAAYYRLSRSVRESGRKGFLGDSRFAGSGDTAALLRTKEDKGLFPEPLFRAHLESVKTNALKIVDGIRAGRFHTTPVSPDDAACDYCPYRTACRMDPLDIPRLRRRVQTVANAFLPLLKTPEEPIP